MEQLNYSGLYKFIDEHDIGNIAKTIKIHPNSINRWRRGERKPKIELLAKICMAYGLELEDLVKIGDGEGEM